MVTANKGKYLIEIYMNLNDEGYTRVSQLAKSLQVSVPSVSKMVKKLNVEEYIEFQKYGMISLTKKGRIVCERLLKKRLVLERFLQFIGVEEENIEKEVKAIESTISTDVVQQIDQFLTKSRTV